MTDPTVRPPTPRGRAWCILRRPATRDATEPARVAQVRGRHPELATASTLAQAFTRMVRERQQTRLDAWLAHATARGRDPFRNCAASRRREDAAVNAGVTLEWSTGPVDGEMNRLKQLKRQMDGRAKLDRLRQRVLAA